MFFLNKRSNFEKKPHELSYRSNICIVSKHIFVVNISRQAQHLAQSFAIKNILLVNRVKIEVLNDTA